MRPFCNELFGCFVAELIMHFSGQHSDMFPRQGHFYFMSWTSNVLSLLLLETCHSTEVGCQKCTGIPFLNNVFTLHYFFPFSFLRIPVAVFNAVWQICLCLGAKIWNNWYLSCKTLGDMLEENDAQLLLPLQSLDYFPITVCPEVFLLPTLIC